MSNVLYGNFPHRFTSAEVEKNHAYSIQLWKWQQNTKEAKANELRAVNYGMKPHRRWMDAWFVQNIRKVFKVIKGEKNGSFTNTNN